MDLKEYLVVFAKAKKLIIFGTLIIVLATVLFNFAGKVKYDSTVTIIVDRTPQVDQKSASYYTYDDYYNIQASGLFADTIVNFIQSPNVVQGIYQSAGITVPPVRNSAQLGKIFTVRKSPPATVTITMRSSDKDQSEKLLLSSIDAVQSLTKDISVKSNAPFNLHPTSPVSVMVEPFWALDIAVAVVVGLLVTTFLALWQHYIKSR